MSKIKLLSKYIVNYQCVMFLFTILVLIGCSSTIFQTKTDVELLQERAKARWDSLIRHDWQSAYSFEPPAYRETYSLENFRSRYGTSVTWKSIKINLVELKNEYDIATVSMDLGYQFLMPGSGIKKSTKKMTERWIKKDGQWWYLHR